MTDVKQGERGHQWATEEDSDKVDEFASNYEYHNGPYCTECSYSYCVHCDAGPSKDCPGWKPSLGSLRHKVAELLHARAATPEVNWYEEELVRTKNVWELPHHAVFLRMADTLVEHRAQINELRASPLDKTELHLDTLKFALEFQWKH